MTLLVDIPADWRSWIESNRARGCTEASLIDAMLRGGIAESRARDWLAAVPAARRLDAPAASAAAATAQIRAGEPYHYGASRLPQHNTVPLDGVVARIAMRLKQPDVALIENFLSAAE
ncbi:MAG: hypothetical protein SV422_10050, partial [Pseudomonadota bacterium]|nr:hypothetical protein [Pseudomonadota bacterium]